MSIECTGITAEKLPDFDPQTGDLNIDKYTKEISGYGFNVYLVSKRNKYVSVQFIEKIFIKDHLRNKNGTVLNSGVSILHG